MFVYFVFVYGVFSDVLFLFSENDTHIEHDTFMLKNIFDGDYLNETFMLGIAF